MPCWSPDIRRRKWKRLNGCDYGSNWSSAKKSYCSKFCFILKKSTRRKVFFDDEYNPIIKQNSRGKLRRPNSKTFGQIMNNEDPDLIDFMTVSPITPEMLRMEAWEASEARRGPRTPLLEAGRREERKTRGGRIGPRADLNCNAGQQNRPQKWIKTKSNCTDGGTFSHSSHPARGSAESENQLLNNKLP